MNRSLTCVLLALTLTLPEITLAQATPTNDWIYPRPSHEDKLFVELKNGKTVTGNFYGIGGALIGAAVLAAPGAATGFIIGMLRHDRQQIY